MRILVEMLVTSTIQSRDALATVENVRDVTRPSGATIAKNRVHVDVMVT